MVGCSELDVLQPIRRVLVRKVARVSRRSGVRASWLSVAVANRFHGSLPSPFLPNRVFEIDLTRGWYQLLSQ